MSGSIRHFENIHIPLWLMKDTCWMLQWKVLGVIMIIPTVAVALLVAHRTRHDEEFYVNLAICFWILANAYWMCCEFFALEAYKDFAGIGFFAGMVAIVMFYRKQRGLSLH
jgi:uncharacterized membrane protein YoaK (UPF0700 family)